MIHMFLEGVREDEDVIKINNAEDTVNFEILGNHDIFIAIVRNLARNDIFINCSTNNRQQHSW